MYFTLFENVNIKVCMCVTNACTKYLLVYGQSPRK